MSDDSAAPVTAPRCAFCLTPFAEGEEVVACPDCRASYHQDCWEENGGCAVYGCRQVPVVQSRQAIEIPISYWGQEEKACPSCGQKILAAAVRCRHCGTTFVSARPENTAEYQRRALLEERMPEVRRHAIWLFICCVIPLSAPVGLVWGAIWYPPHREEVRALPLLYGVLVKLGLAAAAVLTVACAVLTVMYVLVRAP